MPAQDLVDTSGAFAQNIEFFGSDFQTQGGPGGSRARRIRIAIVATTAVNIQATFDGAVFFDIGLTVANALTVIYLPTRDTDLLNLRTSTVAGVTLTALRVDELFNDLGA
jgi:hypothetical protein